MRQNIASSLLVLAVAVVFLGANQTTTISPPKGMVYVPAGSFIMGSDVGDADEAPRQTASTGAFYIDKYEVSNAQFKEFDPTYSFREDRDNHPARVTWEQADAYAQWAGKRLPTETEWEKAARGTDGRVFPWGNTFDNSFVSWDDSYARGSSIARPESSYGCIDMAGGAWEWTASWYKPYKGNTTPCDAYGQTYKVIRGGSSFNDKAMMRTTHRYYVPPKMTGGYYTGFRCVKDAM
jgi:formylglycine-generating enzyme required for sulfatase activity